MNFHSNLPIYLQICDFICQQIVQRKWQAGERIPSIREMAGTLEVNPNTVMRSYEYLQQKSIIENRRGIGYHVLEGSRDAILAEQKSDFLLRQLPKMFEKMQLLQIDIQEIVEEYHKMQESQRVND